MQKAILITSSHYSLKAQSNSGISRLLSSFVPFQLPIARKCLPLSSPRAGLINSTHLMRRKMHKPNMFIAKTISHSVPVSGSDSILKVFDEGQKHKAFVVRHATSLEDLQWVIKRATEEGRMLREKEAECYFAAGLTPDFFIGELNGERITSGCVVRHGDSHYYGGLFFVQKPYREQGYGQKMVDTVVARFHDQCNLHSASVLNIKNARTFMNYPIMPGWISRRYAFDASLARESLASSQFPTSLAALLPASQANFEKMFAYSADMLGTSQVCKSLLGTWISHLQESSWVAIGNTGEVVGYLIMSKTVRFPEDGYFIGPFFADSAPIARSLLKAAVDFAAPHNPGHIFLVIAAHLNPEGVNILENEFGAKRLADLVFFGTNGIPSKPQFKIFGAASVDVM